MGEIELGAAAEATVQTYKEYAKDKTKTLALAQDEICVQFLAYVVAEGTGSLLQNAVDTLELIAENEDCRPRLANTLGVLESLQELADDARYCEELRNQAASIFTCVQFTRLNMKINNQNVENTMDESKSNNNEEIPSTSRNTKHSRKNRRKKSSTHQANKSNINQPVKSKSITLYISGMTNTAQRIKVEDELIRVKGLISIVFDLNRSQVTCRVKKELSIENLAKAVARTREFQAKQVIVESEGREKIVDIGCSSSGKPEDNDTLPDYLPEETSPIRSTDSAMAAAGSLRDAASSFLSAASNLLQKSFYW